MFLIFNVLGVLLHFQNMHALLSDSGKRSSTAEPSAPDKSSSASLLKRTPSLLRAVSSSGVPIQA